MMVYDRTQSDVARAIELRDTKVKRFIDLTDDEISVLEKGTITINTLNRIENKQEELKNLLNALGYWNTPITNKQWNTSQVFDTFEFHRIIDNLDVLRDAFFVFADTPNTPRVSYHFSDINAIEKILHDLDVMINDINSRIRECGAFECGEE